MNTKQIEAYRYYQQQYPHALILFHLPGRYMAIFNDMRTEAFPDDDIGKLSELGDSYELRIIEYRNDAGELDFPDIDQIQNDKQQDY